MTFPFDPNPALLWTLHGDCKVATCQVWFVPIGVMVEMFRNGQLLTGFTFATSEEALACAEEERKRLMECGWTI